MQPYFFPYLGYFDLINYADKWIVFDTVQYIRHGWINRNRILHPADGWLYIIVPVRHSRDMLIKDVRISENQHWRRRIIGQLEHYKKKAPYFQETISLVEECLSYGEDHISRLNTLILDRVCKFIGLEFNYSFVSEMDLALEPVEGPGDWALRICESIGAEEYVNPPGGEHLFDANKFKNMGIELTIRHLPTFEYSCDGYEFVPNLSIIDLLMWNHPTEIEGFLELHR
jgi:hypothetical protein